jgi:heat shock protein 4
VKVRVNLNGIFTVASASLIEKHEVEEEVPMEVDPPKEAEGDKKEGKGEEAENGEEKEPPAAAEAMDAVNDDAAVPKKMEKRMKTVNKTVDLPITPRVVGSLSRDKLEAAAALEKGFVAQDRNESERINSKNSVEEYIYDIRSKIHDELEEFITEEDRSQFSLQLEDAENWLYDEGEEVDKAAYVAKLVDIKNKGEPVKRRKLEFEARPIEIEHLGRALQLAGKIVDMYKAGEEKYNHIDKVDMDKVEKMIREKRDWLDKNSALLSGLKKTADPPVVAQAIRNEKIGFESVVHPILNKAKPKPKVVEPPPMEPEKEGEAKEGEEAKDGAGEPKVDAAPEVAGGGTDPNMDLD